MWGADLKSVLKYGFLKYGGLVSNTYLSFEEKQHVSFCVEELLKIHVFSLQLPLKGQHGDGYIKNTERERCCHEVNRNRTQSKAAEKQRA